MILSILLGFSLVTTPVIDQPNEEVLPRRFRTMQDPVATNIDRKGLDNLRASGSSQFSELGFKAIQKALNYPQNLYVLDLRNESHGFINGMAITWLSLHDWGNKDLLAHEAEADELGHLHEINLNGVMTLYKIVAKEDNDDEALTEPVLTYVTKVSDEKTFIEKQGAHYLRLRIVDHAPPSMETLTSFINFVNSLPPDAWLHIHCRGGAGRTTTFLTLYDILRNGKNVALETILERQLLLGGTDLTNTTKDREWKNPLALERLLFIQNFYKNKTPPQNGMGRRQD